MRATRHPALILPTLMPMIGLDGAAPGRKPRAAQAQIPERAPCICHSIGAPAPLHCVLSAVSCRGRLRLQDTPELASAASPFYPQEPGPPAHSRRSLPAQRSGLRRSGPSGASSPNPA